MKLAVSLLSGGLDSTVTTTIALQETDALIALSIEYGQRHSREIEAAQNVAERLDVEHVIAAVPSIGLLANYSALTGSGYAIPVERDAEAMNGDPPITYVPMRNSIFLAMASALLESRALHLIERDGISPDDLSARLYIGANILDYSGYPDCRPEFYGAIAGALNKGSKLNTTYGVKFSIAAPIIKKTKAEIIQMGMTRGAPLECTWSCYAGGERPCGRCDTCILRNKGFAELGLPDPALEYQPA